jgi:hypothetical protein
MTVPAAIVADDLINEQTSAVYDPKVSEEKSLAGWII